jgi:hypothetical protein
MLSRDNRPVEAKTSEVLAQAIGVVGCGLLGSRAIEELPASFGDGAAALTDLDDLLQLQAVEEVEFRILLFAEKLRQCLGCVAPVQHCHLHVAAQLTESN